MTTPDTENSDPLLTQTNRAATRKKNRRFAVVVYVACVFGITGCSTVPKNVQNQLRAECAHISSRWERVECRSSKEKKWERQQEVDAAITDCKRYWPEEKKMEIAKCVDRKVNPVSKKDGAKIPIGNAAAALAICTALAGGNAASCAAGVGSGYGGSTDKASDRVQDLERELERKQQKFSQDCLFSGGVAVGDTCLNSRR